MSDTCRTLPLHSLLQQCWRSEGGLCTLLEKFHGDSSCPRTRSFELHVLRQQQDKFPSQKYKRTKNKESTISIGKDILYTISIKQCQHDYSFYFSFGPCKFFWLSVLFYSSMLHSSCIRLVRSTFRIFTTDF